MSSACHCFVITGPPGSGKTPLLEKLVDLGFVGVPEPARAVIAEQRAVDGAGIFDRDPQLFLDLMLAGSIRDAVEHAAAERRVFFDRGLPDLIGYAGLFGLDSAAARAAASRHRYHDVVFVLPAWPEIYVTDHDRRMSFQEAAMFGDLVRGVYRDLGYALVDVPRASIDDRAAFVLSAVTELPDGSHAARTVQLGTAADESSPLRPEGRITSSEASPRG